MTYQRIDGHKGYRITRSKNCPVADIAPLCGQTTEAANARLLAAAPELLEACKAASDYFDTVETDAKYDAVIQALNDAIGKAEDKVQ